VTIPGDNPKHEAGSAKSVTHVVPPVVMHELGLAMLEGALKYGAYNWRTAGLVTSTYYDAARRHLDAWWEGEDTDLESGVSHLVKAMACMVVIRDAEVQGMVLVDDRPPKTKDGWQQDINKQVQQLRERFDGQSR